MTSPNTTNQEVPSQRSSRYPGSPNAMSELIMRFREPQAFVSGSGSTAPNEGSTFCRSGTYSRLGSCTRWLTHSGAPLLLDRPTLVDSDTVSVVLAYGSES